MSNSRRKTYRVISLFSGCGGADLGFRGGFDFLSLRYQPLPFEIVWANDADGFATSVYKHNLGVEIDTGDVTKTKFQELAVKGDPVDVLVAGFPCQDFSLTGPREGLGSHRGRLYREIRRALRHFSPKLFLAENVPGIEYPPKILTTVIRGLAGRKAPKYRIKVFRVNAADYGVPQIRRRVFIVGTRIDLSADFDPPVPTHYSPEVSTPNLPGWVTARDALEDLWEPAGPESSEIPDQAKFTRATIILKRPKRRDRRLNSETPAPTIRAQHHGHIEVHYNTQSDGSLRRLTIRECARLQGFPDSFVFPVTATQAYQQIGNAMPPVAAYHWARSVLEWLEGQEIESTTAPGHTDGKSMTSLATPAKHRDQAVTSQIMSAVKSTGSKAEKALGTAMWESGLRYRKHPRGLIGRPDYAFIGPKVAVFCDGDFWHGKGWKGRGFQSWDEQFVGLRNPDFWKEKIARNMARDERVNIELRETGWIVLRFLESEILRDPGTCVESISAVIAERRAGRLKFLGS